jgi:hypothetical protein
MKVRKAVSSRAPIIAIHGEEGKGKTTFAAKAPKTLALLYEPGLPRGVTVDEVQDIGSFDKTMTALREIYAAPGEYRSLMIDTLDALEPRVIEHVCAENHWKNIEAPSYGKGYVLVADKWRHVVRACADLHQLPAAAAPACARRHHGQLRRGVLHRRGPAHDH